MAFVDVIDLQRDVVDSDETGRMHPGSLSRREESERRWRPSSGAT
jgi:hypothetical protein